MSSNLRLEEQFEEQVSANLLVGSNGPRKAFRLMVDQLNKMFIGDVLVGRGLSGTLYYNTSKDFQNEPGIINYYMLREVPTDPEHRIYVNFYKEPRREGAAFSELEPKAPNPIPYASFTAPDLKRYVALNEMDYYSSDGKWGPLNLSSSAAAVSRSPDFKEIKISVPGVRLEGSWSVTGSGQESSHQTFVTQGVIYYADNKILQTSERALWSPDNIVFYTKYGANPNQIGIFIAANDSVLPGGYDLFEGVLWKIQG